MLTLQNLKLPLSLLFPKKAMLLSPICLPLRFLIFPNDSAFRLAENPVIVLCFLTFPNDSAFTTARFRIWCIGNRVTSLHPEQRRRPS